MAAKSQTTPLCTRSLRLLGDFWTLRIVHALQSGPLRYCDLQRAAGDINPVTLGNRLHKLQAAGLVRRTASAKDIAVSYELTGLGKQALPVVRAIDMFSKLLPPA